jgi:hypothetical protein
MVRGRDVGFAAREGFGDAQEADEVGAVGVEELSVVEDVSELCPLREEFLPGALFGGPIIGLLTLRWCGKYALYPSESHPPLGLSRVLIHAHDRFDWAR